MNIVLLGPPGCGKGTQADHICHEFKIKYISIGNMLREEVQKKTELGNTIKPIMEAGHMIDNAITNEIIKKNLPKNKGVLFDGYPRSVPQAQALDEFSHVDVVLFFNVPQAELVRRLSNRWMVELNHNQHTFINKEKAQEFVKYHGGRIFRREDDKPEHVKERLKVYTQTTKPLIDYYGRQHKLYLVHADKPIPTVWREIKQKIEKLSHKKKHG